MKLKLRKRITNYALLKGRKEQRKGGREGRKENLVPDVLYDLDFSSSKIIENYRFTI